MPQSADPDWNVSPGVVYSPNPSTPRPWTPSEPAAPAPLDPTSRQSPQPRRCFDKTPVASPQDLSPHAHRHTSANIRPSPPDKRPSPALHDIPGTPAAPAPHTHKTPRP